MRPPRRRKDDAHGTPAALRAIAILTLAVAGACGDGPPVARPHAEQPPPPIRVDSGFIEYPAPAESLLVYEHDVGDRGGEEPRLLFARGRGVAHDASGAAYVPDLPGSRVLVVGPGMRVRRTVGGPDPAKGPLGFPLSAAPTPDGSVFLVDVEHPDGLLYYDPGGSYVGAATPPVLAPIVRAGTDGVLWAARSPYLRGFDPAPAGDPLLYRFDPLTGEGVGIATVEPVALPAWNRLANAGPLAVGGDGVAYFAFLLRNELRAYRADGTLLWRVRRALPFETIPSVIEAEDSGIRVQPITQALAIGPDRQLYALTATLPTDSAPPSRGAASEGSSGRDGRADTTGRRRLEVYEAETGALLRAATVPDAWTTLAADRDGRVYRVDPDAIDATAPPPERAPLPDVPLVAFDGDTARFAEYRGRALLVNFWASWCLPCREELPQLAELYEDLADTDRPYVEFLAISDDDDPAAARRFIEPFRLPFPVFRGGGAMQERFGYVALPYTLIVDYRGRIVQELYGFGSPESWSRLTSALRAEIERARPSSDPDLERAPHGHETHGRR